MKEVWFWLRLLVYLPPAILATIALAHKDWKENKDDWTSIGEG